MSTTRPSGARSEEHTHGLDVDAVVLTGGPTGQIVSDLAASERFRTTTVPGVGATRQCTSVLAEDSGLVTELYEPLAHGQRDDGRNLLTAVERLLDGSASFDLVAISGRIAPGHDARTMGSLVRLVADRHVPVLVDSDGEALRHAVAAAPSYVKVNRAEASRLVESVEPAPAAELAERIVALTGRIAIVTDGAAGAAAADTRTSVSLAPPSLDGAAAVGSGDAFVAGLAATLPRSSQLKTVSLEAQLIGGIAAARVNARRLPAGQICRTEWDAEHEYLEDWRHGRDPSMAAEQHS